MEWDGAILIVEDDEGVLHMALQAFESLGQKALGAATGSEAISLLEEHQEIKGVFSNWVISGGMSGLQLVERVRERWPHIATALTSGYPDQVYAAPELVPQGSIFIQKPYRMGELNGLISWVHQH